MRVPILESARLRVRPFDLDDLDAVHQLLDVDLADADFGSEGAKTLADRRRWLQWTVLNYEELARLYQPPYGDRAIVARGSGELIGACGYVPSLGPFRQLAALRGPGDTEERGLMSPEFGLYYAVAPRRQRQGYATEAARLLVDYAFGELSLRRVIATTTADNAGSIGVMHRLGMRIDQNPYADPPWLQVVGVLDNPARHIG